MPIQAPLYSPTGESKGQFELPDTIFGGPGSRRVLQEVIMALQGNQRRGTSSTKTRGNVRGGGRKPWKQKGTGNARAGSIRSPLWRKGGIIFGPLPRSYRIDMTGSKKLLALQTALVEKSKASQLGVVESIEFKEGKAKEGAQFLKKTGLKSSILLVVDKNSANLSRAIGNVVGLSICEVSEVNAWILLRAKQVLFSRAAFDLLLNRFPKG